MSHPSAYKWLTGSESEHPDYVSVHDILTTWTNHDLESVHNYIQWCFPLTEKSNFSIAAPILTPREIAAIKKSPKAQEALVDLMWRMTDFYDKTGHWLVPHDHNHLRITRIIKSLGILCPPQYALGFYHFVMWRCCLYTKPCIINPQSIAIWQKAAEEIGYPGLVESDAIKKEVKEILHPRREVTFTDRDYANIEEQRHGGEKFDPHPHNSIDNIVYLQAVAQEGGV